MVDYRIVGNNGPTIPALNKFALCGEEARLSGHAEYSVELQIV